MQVVDLSISGRNSSIVVSMRSVVFHSLGRRQRFDPSSIIQWDSLRQRAGWAYRAWIDSGALRERRQSARRVSTRCNGARPLKLGAIPIAN